MTTEEIDAIPAGPEMDRLIVERIFGRHVQSFPQTKLGGTPDPEWVQWIEPDNPAAGFAKIPPYSTALSAATDVLFTFSLFEVARDEKGFRADLRSEALEWFEVYAETLPLAICRAALKVSLK